MVRKLFPLTLIVLVCTVGIVSARALYSESAGADDLEHNLYRKEVVVQDDGMVVTDRHDVINTGDTATEVYTVTLEMMGYAYSSVYGEDAHGQLETETFTNDGLFTIVVSFREPINSGESYTFVVGYTAVGMGKLR